MTTTACLSPVQEMQQHQGIDQVEQVMTNSRLQPEDEAWLAWARAIVQQDPVKIVLIKHIARPLQSSRVER